MSLLAITNNDALDALAGRTARIEYWTGSNHDGDQFFFALALDPQFAPIVTMVEYRAGAYDLRGGTLTVPASLVEAFLDLPDRLGDVAVELTADPADLAACGLDQFGRSTDPTVEPLSPPGQHADPLITAVASRYGPGRHALVVDTAKGTVSHQHANSDLADDDALLALAGQTRHVWVLTVTDKHGDWTEVFEDHDKALDSLAEWVENELPGRHADDYGFAVDDDGEPILPDRDELIDVFFDEADSDYYALQHLPVG